VKFLVTSLLILGLGVCGSRAELLYEIADVPAPAGRNALGTSLAKAPDGTLWLSWVETGAGDGKTLLFSTFDLAAKKWGPSHPIARGSEITATSAECPALAVGPAGRVGAVWPNGRGAAFFSQSSDNGKTWSSPTPLTHESDAVEKLSLVALPDGHFMGAWLDGRGAKTGPKVEQLFARVLDQPGPDRLVDASVCDCCPTSLTAFPDGTVLLAYRGRTAEEIRDIMVASYLEGQWDPRHANTHDRWKIAGCPVNGPRVSSDGPRVAKAWFTAADNEARVLVATSPDAGGIYTRATRADLGRPLGRVDTVLLHDGTQLVTWLEKTTNEAGHATGALYLRRYGPSGSTHAPVRLAELKDVQSAGIPRLAVAKDFDATPAQLVVTFNRSAEAGGWATLLVTMPDEDALADADSTCACAAGRTADLRGFPIRAQALAFSPQRSTIRLRYGAIPGVFRAGEGDFKISDDLSGALKTPAEILGRIEKRDGEWWLFDVRQLGQPVR
jgi:hypothetical protein